MKYQHYKTQNQITSLVMKIFRILLSNYANILKLPPMSHIHDQISSDEKDLSEATIDIMKKTKTTEYGELKFVVLEKMEAGTPKHYATL